VAFTSPYLWGGDFSEGLANVTVNSKVGYIDSTGKLAIEPQFDQGMMFNEGIAVVSVDQQWGYIDSTGKLIVTPTYETAYNFANGMGLVVTNSLSGFVDKTGKEVIKPQYEQAQSFSNGLAAVMVDGKWGFINMTGTMVISPQFNYVSNSYVNQQDVTFTDGLAAASITDEEGTDIYGYINVTGTFVITPQYSWASAFENGLARVDLDGGTQQGYIDTTGKMVWGPVEISYTSTYVPASDKLCNSVNKALNESLGQAFVATTAAFTDTLMGGQGESCQSQATGNGKDFSLADSTKINQIFETLKGEIDPDYSADGPTGTVSGYRLGSNLCLSQIEWALTPEVECDSDEPISACKFTPEQQIFTVTVDCVQPNNQPY
jgi:hypothetical protein